MQIFGIPLMLSVDLQIKLFIQNVNFNAMQMQFLKSVINEMMIHNERVNDNDTMLT